MAPLYLFCLIWFSQLVLIFSAGYGNEYQDNCPRCFDCGRFGRLQYPFTKSELPHCGLLIIHGCDNGNNVSPKKIQLQNNGSSIDLNAFVEPNKVISVYDDDFHKRLQQETCHTLNNNYSIPSPSPLVSFYIKYNVTLFRCKNSLNITAPPHFFRSSNCSVYDFYFDKNSTSSDHIEDVRNTFSECSLVQFPSKDLADTTDIPSFVSAQMVLEVVLSDACDYCYNHRKGRCRLDANKNFYCHEEPKNKWKALRLGLGLGIGLGITLLGILITGCFLARRYRGKHGPPEPYFESKSTLTDPYAVANADLESGMDNLGIPLFSYEELKEATNNFHHTTQLGSGGFGTVYHGKLRDRRDVAVKHLYEHNYRRLEQFTNEIKILTRIRHRNLVSLYGCTSRRSHELLLVYEYVPNGTVAYHLHGDLARTATLPWHIRMKIAIETAVALSYLHASDIIHRDVKTSNILLDNSYTVKVADFGLSRLFPNDVTHVSTAPQGTPGYVDPEYYRCYQLTSKSDVYSFGVVLIELISSKPAVDMNRNKDEINLSDLAIKKIQKSAISELVDLSLGFDSDNEVRRMMVSVAELAFQCLQKDRELRPSMHEVLKVLATIGSGKDKAEVVDELPPPSSSSSSPCSPDLNEMGLLKRATPPLRWSSESSTPNASG